MKRGGFRRKGGPRIFARSGLCVCCGENKGGRTRVAEIDEVGGNIVSAFSSQLPVERTELRAQSHIRNSPLQNHSFPTRYPIDDIKHPDRSIG